MALMDWGLDRYQVDVDYVKVSVVRKTDTKPDLGEPLPDHPPTPPLDTFTHILVPSKTATIDSANPDRANAKQSPDNGQKSPSLLTVDETKVVILGWDFGLPRDYEIAGPAILQLTTQRANIPPQEQEDLGLLRISELYTSNRAWKSDTASWDRIHQGQSTADVINSQMIIDQAVETIPGSANRFVLSSPSVHRLLNGQSSGIALSPLGVIEAQFYSPQSENAFHPRLYLKLKKK